MFDDWKSKSYSWLIFILQKQKKGVKLLTFISDSVILSYLYFWLWRWHKPELIYIFIVIRYVNQGS